MRFVVEIACAAGSGQDRANAIELDGGVLLAVADGAGGTGNGTTAAEAIVHTIDRETALPDVARCEALLEDLDANPRALGHGQSTAVILAVRETVAGASVGDSEAWLIRGDEVVDLTFGQLRKPLVGDGCATYPVGPVAFEGTLLVATDGLFRYAKRADIVRVIAGQDLAAAALALVELVRLPNGELQDDVGVMLVASPRRS